MTNPYDIQIQSPSRGVPGANRVTLKLLNIRSYLCTRVRFPVHVKTNPDDLIHLLQTIRHKPNASMNGKPNYDNQLIEIVYEPEIVHNIHMNVM